LAARRLFFLWGRKPTQTEAFVASLPAGGKLVAGLRHLDAFISPRDPDADRIARIGAWLRRRLEEGAVFRSASERPAIEEWGFRTRDFIAAAFGAAEAKFFMEDHGLRYLGSMETIFVKGRMHRLREMLDRLDRMPVSEHFDPAPWEP
jgi:hypothetical protein